ncbi:PB1 domain protein, putative [Talaromyces stipitatus ATCC 10500]|uniref:PB1 domain protein, putative n=1 Tax=Talaromyces stipitatus (strain ATCC 10500 / CBS 375.48 / QM 6759 / NRRL 1006) TaxID=441959 RepID=B8MC91_TALSN|nr:PB1 domain protein, putative [Talaromyces stipitatus ATCC 10500]EED18537.1 PB1 domain protein, putative [Talaromyces stipitatus ATCC 10500]
MSLKQEIETWVQALAHYDNNEYDEALRVFDNIADTSKILFNCGVIHATLGEHEKAVECYQRAVSLDNYLAVAYFQQGVSNFLLGDFEEALANFNDTLLYLRGNTSIDYEQLGLKFRLFSCEVLFNRGLSYIYLQQMEPGLQDLQFASKEKVTPDHDVIDEAIREQAEGYTVFSIPVGVVYRPNEAKVKNLKTKDYLGKARLVAASDRNNAFTGFQGAEMRKVIAVETAAKDDRPAENISYAATNLVQKNLMSRSRQQSEPPLGRNTFPPTPPPESDKNSTSSNASMVGGLTQRAASVRSGVAGGGGGRPPRLELDRPGGAGTNGRTGGDLPSMEKSRIGTTRTASEPRGPASRQYSTSSRARDGRPRLYRETTGSSRRGGGDGGFDYVPEEGYAGEVIDMYATPRTNGNGYAPRPRQQQPRYIEEEPEYSSEYDDEIPEAEFEMMNEQPPPRQQRSRYSQPQSASSGGQGRRAPSSSRRRTMPEIRKFRVKVHALEDTRYIMIESNIGYGEFEGRIREKFGFRGLLRIRMRDDNDMITMGDQEDLDMLLNAARNEARRENQEMGKIEIWVEERI